MIQPIAGLIKKHQIQEAGACPVGAQAAAAETGPSARIVDQQPNASTVEIICTCGRRLELRCEHAQ